MKKSIIFSVFIIILVSGVYAQSFRVNNILYEVASVDYFGNLSRAEYSSLTTREEILALETSFRQSFAASSDGLRITSFNLRDGNVRTTAENQIVQWLLDNSIPYQNSRVGDTFICNIFRDDQDSGYLVIFYYSGNNNWNNLLFSFTYR